MRIMILLIGAAVLVYFITGIWGTYTRRQRFLMALGTYIVVYLATIFVLVFLENGQ
ncbi:MAG: hypothetical protein JRF07_05125 [Deltaproteobacteria bacterium]|jgi:hypothetical protein|nr:hypothetical protein [Deltaproteobacteria bacterium]